MTIAWIPAYTEINTCLNDTITVHDHYNGIIGVHSGDDGNC